MRSMNKKSWGIIWIPHFYFVPLYCNSWAGQGGGIGRRYMFWKEIGIIPTLNQIKDFTGSNPVLDTKIKAWAFCPCFFYI